jgi:hypothetical protein
MTTAAHADGDVIDLGFADGTGIHWILSGGEDNYHDTYSPVDWMQQTMDILRHRPLSQVCMPGSHDAGMSELNSPTFGATTDNTQTQSWGIGDQLVAGSRFFDLRPVISDGAFRMGHYSKAVGQWAGGAGMSLADIMDQVNGFTAGNGELVILWLSHFQDTDNGYVDFDQSNFDDLYNELSNLDSLFTEANGHPLTDVSMDTYIGDGTACVVVVTELPEGIKVDREKYPWAYTSDEFGAWHNDFSDTDDLDTMRSDQIAKMRSYRQVKEGGIEDFFVLSWTLTQSISDILLGGFSSIRDLACQAWQPLFEAFDKFTPQSFPNVLMIDLYGAGVLASILDDVAIPPGFNGSIPIGSNSSAPVNGSAPGTPYHGIPRRPRYPKSKALNSHSRHSLHNRMIGDPSSSSFTPGLYDPVNDVAGLAMAINYLAEQNSYISGN